MMFDYTVIVNNEHRATEASFHRDPESLKMFLVLTGLKTTRTVFTHFAFLLSPPVQLLILEGDEQLT